MTGLKNAGGGENLSVVDGGSATALSTTTAEQLLKTAGASSGRKREV